MSSPTIRRSQRSRKPVESIYDKAQRELSQSIESPASNSTRRTITSASTVRSPTRSSPRKKSISVSIKKTAKVQKNNDKKQNVDERNDDNNEEEENIDEQLEEDEDDRMMSSSSSEDDDSDDEEAAVAIERERKRQSPAKRKVVQIKETDESTRTKNQSQRKNKSITNERTPASDRRQIQVVMMAMAKKVLNQDDETIESSLLGALLHSRNRQTDDKNPLNITNIARKAAHQLVIDINHGHIDLLNLIFRSVGGTYENLIKYDINLDEVSDDELALVIQQVVDDMAETPADAVLLCADPQGAFGGRAGGSLRPKLAAREYRLIYQEFWYELGLAIVSVSINEKDSTETNNNVEIARDLITRLMEFVWVGVPDIRAGVAIAIYQMATALLYRTSQWQDKLQVAQRQYQAAKRVNSSSLSSKAKALQAQVDSLKNSTDALETIVRENVISVFLKRYRDKNEHIRVESMNALSSFTLARPDIFLNGLYLKYFGWLLSDKEAVVRRAAIIGLLAPFREHQENQNDNKSKQNISKIDTTGMTSVIQKFLTRLADCVIDVDVSVQEVAMELLLYLVRNNFFDDVENDRIWQQINLRAIAPDTSLSVRRNALYFVMEQLQKFDEGSSNSDNDAIERIKALVEWISHVLSDSDIPIEHIRYDLTDLLVASLRSMDEHKALVSNWTAILGALQKDNANTKKRGSRNSINKGDQRQSAVQQRVVLRLLVSSAELEVRSLAGKNQCTIMTQDIDKDLLEIQKAENGIDEFSGKIDKRRSTTSQEELTLALLRALPELLISFKSENPVLQSLTTLPRYLLPSVFNLSSRKNDFHALISNLSKTFLESTDETVLNNCALALVSLTRGDHARKDEALLILKKTATSLKQRLFKLLEEKGKHCSEKNDGDDDMSDTEIGFSLKDTEQSLFLCLRRLRVLSKRWYLPDLLNESSDVGKGDEQLEDIFLSVSDHFTKELTIRQLVLSQENMDEVDIPNAWSVIDDEVHTIVAASISESLDLLLSLLAWKVSQVVNALKNSTHDDGEDDDDEEDLENHVILKLRDQMIKLVVLCYEQFIEQEFLDIVSKCQVEFANSLQIHAGRLTGDLRMLFPKNWVSAKSKVLSSLALTQEVHLVGGLVRFVRSQEQKLREGQEGKDNSEAIHTLLLPLARGLAGNWLNGNRKEAGVALAHISGSGKEAHNLVQSLSRVCKKIHPVRLLESHMAYLRQDFNDWKSSLPDELESDRPTDDELAEYEAAEKAHKAKFEAIENRASRLSASLGVGSIRDKTLAPALIGFVREGLRFSFSMDMESSSADEELLLGDRLSFLLPLSKYLNWIRRNKGAKELLTNDINKREADLRTHPDYDEIYDEDKIAIDTFRKTGELGPFINIADDEVTIGKSTVNTNATNNNESSIAGGSKSTINNESNKSRTSIGGGGGGSLSSASIRSKFSSSQSLSPLREVDNEEEGEGDNNKDDENTHMDNDDDKKIKKGDADDDSIHDDDDEISQLSLSPQKNSNKRRKVISSSNVSSALSLTTMEDSALAEDNNSDNNDDSKTSI